MKRGLLGGSEPALEEENVDWESGVVVLLATHCPFR